MAETSHRDTNQNGPRYNGADEPIYNQTEANDTIRMSQEDVQDFDGITIDELGQEIHVEEPPKAHNPYGSFGGAFGQGEEGANPFSSAPGLKIFNIGSWGCIIAILILMAIIGLFFAGIFFFAKYILVGILILALIFGFNSFLG